MSIRAFSSVRAKYTTFIYPNGTCQNGPDMPLGGYYFCAIPIDDKNERILIFGGRNPSSTATNRVWIYDDMTETFTEKDNRNFAQLGVNCGRIFLKDGRDVVLAVGSEDHSAYADVARNAEIYDIAADRWEEKPEFNLREIRGAGQVFVTADRRRFFILGGRYNGYSDFRDTIVEFKEGEGFPVWKVLKQKLPRGTPRLEMTPISDYPKYP